MLCLVSATGLLAIVFNSPMFLKAMKGFDIIINRQEVFISSHHQLLTINLFYSTKEKCARLYTGSYDSTKNQETRRIWHNQLPIELEQEVDIRFTTFDRESIPTKDETKVLLDREKEMKLENFLRFEAFLKKKGVI